MENSTPFGPDNPQPPAGFSPPPLRPPPVISVPHQALPKPRKSIGWMITALVLLCLLGLSLLFNLSGFLDKLVPANVASMHRTSGPRMEEMVTEYARGSDKIAVIRIEGVIMSDLVDGTYGLVDMVREQLKRAANDEDVKAVLLKVDSPGGEVLASDEIYRAVLKFQKDSRKPVVASMGNVAASGGYYVSAPCQWIVANEMTITGSIGVIMSGFNYRGLMDKVGVRPEVFKSGKFKDMLRGSKKDDEITTEERKMIQDLIDETFQQFKTVVREGREFAAGQNQKQSEKGKALVTNWAEFADGRIFSGKEALRHGFVDEVGNFQTAVARAKKLAGISDASLIQYQPIYDLSHFLRLFGKSEATTVKVDVGLDLPKLKAGQLYFLAPTFVR